MGTRIVERPVKLDRERRFSLVPRRWRRGGSQVDGGVTVATQEAKVSALPTPTLPREGTALEPDRQIEAPANLKTVEGFASYMRGSKSEADWNARCDAVKAANGGKYPGDWFQTVIASGLLGEVSSTWGGSAEIQIIELPQRPTLDYTV